MRIAVALLTCDRIEYTRRTCESFLDLHRRQIPKTFSLFFADDASNQPVVKTVSKLGFKLLVQNATRIGCSPTTSLLVDACKKAMGMDSYIMILQNDWEFVRPINLDVIRRLFKSANVGCVRLYGKYKDSAKRQKSSPFFLGCKKRKLVDWMPKRVLGEPMEVGRVHWCYNPSVTRMPCAVRWTNGARKEGDVISASAMEEFRTYRFCDNMVYHIGEEGTPGGMFGRDR